jgi:hypothetical protein
MPDLTSIGYEGILSTLFGKTYTFPEFPYLDAYNYILKQEPSLSFDKIKDLEVKFPQMSEVTKIFKIIEAFVVKHKETLLLLKNNQVWKDVFTESKDRGFSIPLLNDCVKLGQDLGYETKFDKKEGIITTKETPKCYKWWNEHYAFQELSEHGIKSISDLRTFITNAHTLDHTKWGKVKGTLSCDSKSLLASESKRDHLVNMEFTNPLSKLNYLRAKTYLNFMFSPDIYSYFWNLFYFWPLTLLKVIFDELTEGRIIYTKSSANVRSAVTNTEATYVKTLLDLISSTSHSNAIDIHQIAAPKHDIKTESLIFGPKVKSSPAHISLRKKMIAEAYKICTSVFKEPKYVKITSVFKKPSPITKEQKAWINGTYTYHYILYEYKAKDLLRISGLKTMDEVHKKFLDPLRIDIENKVRKIHDDFSIPTQYPIDPYAPGSDQIGWIALDIMLDSDTYKEHYPGQESIPTQSLEIESDIQYKYDLTAESILNYIYTKLSISNEKHTPTCLCDNLEVIKLFSKLEEIRIAYGFWDTKRNKQIYDTDPIFFNDKYIEKYCYVQKPYEVWKHQIAICWDMALLVYDTLKDHVQEIHVPFYVRTSINVSDPKLKNIIVTHTPVLFKDNNTWYWFEYSWRPKRGVHLLKTCRSYSDAVTYLKQEIIKHKHNETICHINKDFPVEQVLKMSKCTQSQFLKLGYQ